MAIFKKDLENINSFNEKNRKINVRSELLQFINLQNEAPDYDFSDLKFELEVNFKQRFEQHRKIFKDIANKKINDQSFASFINIFNDFSVKNIGVFSSLERLIYEIKNENDLFEDELSLISNSIKNSKKNRFDLLHSFLLNAYPSDITDDSVLLADTSTISTTIKNLEDLNLNSSIEDKKLVNLYNNIVKNPIHFLKTYAGFNFIKTDDFNLIQNHNKPLSLMALATSINNVIENAFDYASCNSLFTGIYTDTELNSKLKFVELTNVPVIERDITKEILPIKYVDEFEYINNAELAGLIEQFNSALDEVKNVKKAEKEKIPTDIFNFENFLCSEADISQVSFTSKAKRDIIDDVSVVSISESNEKALPHEILLNTITASFKNNLISLGKKSELASLEGLNLIANHVNSNQLKLMYGVVNKTNGQVDYSGIKYRPVIDTNKKGILNYKFEDIENFTSSIIKTRLICNNIVKKYKKHAINKGLDASVDSNVNRINYFLSKKNNNRSSIEYNIKASSLLDSILKINASNTTIINFINSFNNQDNIFEIFNKKNNKINQDLIIINNTLLGEMNADDFIGSNFPNVINLNRQINTDAFNLNNVIAQTMNIKADVKKFIGDYYSDEHPVFKNSATFFQEIKNLCSENFKWHLNKKNNTKSSSDRADLLNNASIFWLFNDACKEMTKENKEKFQENFVNLLIAFIYISNKNINSLKTAYSNEAERVIMTEGPSSATVTELAPFFSFFTAERQTATNNLINSKNLAVRRQSNQTKKYNEYYNNTMSVFETNGKSTHFLSVPAQLLDNGLNISYNSGHKLCDNFDLDYIGPLDTFNERKKNILLAGFNSYSKKTNNQSDDREYYFIPQLTFKKIFYGNNQYKFEYFLYNSAMAEQYSESINANSYDLIQILIDTFGANNPDILNQLSYNFVTQNSFLNVLNFNNPYNTSLENNALDNNIFYQITNLFKTLIGNLPLTTTTNDFFGQIKNSSNTNILDLKFLIKNTLKVVSSIYCKMFNSLQSYTNLADRISESNFFYENSPRNQRELQSISPDAINDDSSSMKIYSKKVWGHYSNVFLNDVDLYTHFTYDEFQKYRSFASKKFVYFLNEVLGIEKNEIEILMEHILAQKIRWTFEGDDSFEQTGDVLYTRFKRLYEYFNRNDRSQLNDLAGNTNILRVFGENNNIEFMTNPFELFNLYDSTLFQLIPGVYNFNDGEIDYQLDLTPNLTLMNLFKAGNNSDLPLQQWRNVADRQEPIRPFTISDEEILKFQDRLIDIDLFRITERTSAESVNTAQLIFGNYTRQTKSSLIPIYIRDEFTQGNSVLDQFSWASDPGDIEYARDSGRQVSNSSGTAGGLISEKIGINFRDFDNDVAVVNKKNYNIKAKVSAIGIFDLIIENSFEFSLNYQNIPYKKIEKAIEISDTALDNATSDNANQFNLDLATNDIRIQSVSALDNVVRLSGLNESYNYDQNFMKLKSAIKIDQIGLNLISEINQGMINQKYVDINLNWYNHIIHGLIVNDLGLAMSLDILLYYYDNFIKDIEKNQQKLTQLRNQKITINNFNLNVNDAKSNLRGFANLDNDLFELSTDNLKIQKNYIKSLIKAKSFKNIVNVRTVQDIFNNGLNRFVDKITTLNSQNENGEFFMSYFDDFYIKDLWYTLNTKSEEEFRNKINTNYQKINNTACVPNQAEKLIGSHILTVGINNDYQLDKDDIVLIKVEMTDHDFPEIIWEPKIFEYCAAFDDMENIFLQYRNVLKVQSIDDITNENPPVAINSFYSDFELNEAALSTDNGVSLKDALIQKNPKTVNGLDLSNNIGSLNYKGERSYLNPVVYQNNFDNILEIMTLSNDDFIYSKIPQTFRDKLLPNELTTLRNELLRRCVHNQKMNLRLKKISKLLNGFEPNPEFSLSNNKWMQEMFVSSDIYQVFIEDFNGSKDSIKELYPFTYEEISNAVELNAYNYAGLNFHKLNFTTNHKLNVYLQFMSDFTKAVIPDFISMTRHNFQKVYTLAINPKDFIVTGLTGGNSNFVPNSSELDFQKIIYSSNSTGFPVNIQNKILDEIGTETSLVLRLTSNKTDEIDDVTYYSVINKKNNERYIPKNVSYRISTMILE